MEEDERERRKFKGKETTKCEEGNEKYKEKNREGKRRSLQNVRRIKS
jgi:hypothetical protein